MELRRFGSNPVVFRLLVAIFLGIGVFQLLRVSNFYYQAKNYTVGEGGDRIVAYDPRLVAASEGVELTVRWLKENSPATSTVAVLPEGVLINYLARRANPTPFPVLPPPEFQAHGESRVMAAFVRNPPDYIVLVHRDSAEFGLNYFGQEPGYGMETMKWIQANYSPVWQYGAEPLTTERFGIRILARSAAGKSS
ncbi:MAG TPA: hypothetical protein PLP42_09935 [Acidobacteriota bacterium]|nr:hypothetical protein [Acidobacteriota bacterium]